MPEAEQGMNMARNIAHLAGLPKDVSGITINRYCSSVLQSIAFAAERIMVGHADAIIAGGTKSLSLIPVGGDVIKTNTKLLENTRRYYMVMDYTAEEVDNSFNILSEDQDAFAVESHKRAAQAIKEGKFDDEIVPVEVTERVVGEDGKIAEKTFMFEMDEGVRPNTNMEILSKLRPAFHVKGSVTAGNSSQMSDGAASVLVMDREKAEAEGLTPYSSFIPLQSLV